MSSLATGWLARWAGRLGSLLAVVTLAACGGGGSASGEGTLRVAMTDAPACGYEHVFVTVEKVRVHTSASAGDGEAGWQEITLSPPRRIDLLNLTNGVLEELGSTPLPAGRYSQVRLVLASNNGSAPLANAVQPTGGALVPLRTPSAMQSGLKLQVHFEVKADEVIDLVLDFDACKSVVRSGNSGNFNLKPVVSVVPRLTTTIEGYVATALSPSATMVSAQQNGVVVRSTVPDASGRFVLAFLPEGTYNLVVASEGHATAVVTGVPVAISAGRTIVSGTATAIAPPVSTMAEVTGTTSVGTSTLVVDATVTAQQALSGGPTITVASTAVDADLATYQLRLPLAAPVKAAYSTSALSFTADTAVAGKYTLLAAAPGRTTVAQAVTLTGNQTVNLVFAP